MTKKNTVTFEEFKESCAERGYTERVYAVDSVCVLYSNNGIKCEIKKSHYVVGWGGRQEDVAEIRRLLLEEGFNEKSGKRSEKRKDEKDYILVSFEGISDVLEGFWRMLSIIESIETIVKRTRGIAIKPIPREVSERNIFEKIAKRFRYFIENEDGFGLENARALLEGDSIDHLITIGESLNRVPENSYREHIVPCIMVYNQAVTMTLAGSSITEIAQMIKNNLAIVLITNEEADSLDNELGMQTTMPEGWEFGHNVFARLNVAGIKLK